MRFAFLVRNLRRSMGIERIQSRRVVGDVEMGGVRLSQIGTVGSLYTTFTKGKVLSPSLQTLLVVAGSRLCLVVRNTEEVVVGFSLYYFNDRDVRDQRAGSIHEGFTGLLQDYRGRGIGTRMRRHALEHFASCGLKWMSSRISVDNEASLRSNVRLGFDVIDKYYDSASNKDRYYLVCDLEQHRGGEVGC